MSSLTLYPKPLDIIEHHR